jgi:hypothetical protein
MVVFDRTVSKTVKIMSAYNRTDMAGENLRKIHPGNGIFLMWVLFY